MDRTVTPKILRRDGHRCVACGCDLPFALQVHHKVPFGYGGTDEEPNLTTLCANCHRIVHWLAVGRRLEGRPAVQVERSLGAVPYRVIRGLSARIRRHRKQILLAGNRWLETNSGTRGPIPLEDALRVVASRNGLGPDEARQMRRVVARALRSIPSQVREKCSVRLVRNGSFLSVNAGNHLVLRTLAYTDDGARQDADVLLVWPCDIRISVVPRNQWSKVRGSHRFAAIPCFNIGLTFDEALSLETCEWRIFGGACRDALLVRRTRSWISNVTLP